MVESDGGSNAQLDPRVLEVVTSKSFVESDVTIGALPERTKEYRVIARSRYVTKLRHVSSCAHITSVVVTETIRRLTYTLAYGLIHSLQMSSKNCLC